MQSNTYISEKTNGMCNFFNLSFPKKCFSKKNVVLTEFNLIGSLPLRPKKHSEKNIKKNLHIPTAIINFAAVYNKIKNHYGAYR